jgi:hypothetical protein
VIRSPSLLQVVAAVCCCTFLADGADGARRRRDDGTVRFTVHGRSAEFGPNLVAREAEHRIQVSWRTFSVDGTFIAHVHRYYRMPNGWVVYQSCEPVGGDLNGQYVRLGRWHRYETAAGRNVPLDPPGLHPYFSAPAFAGRLMAYWALEEDGRVAAVVYHLVSLGIVRRRILGREAAPRDVSYPMPRVQATGTYYRFTFNPRDGLSTDSALRTAIVRVER